MQELTIITEETLENTTPMMRQYLATKNQYQDCLLFYRMGDFYEMFFDDAVLAAEILDIALTKRGSFEGKPIPMCGVPAHSYEAYLYKLIEKGQKVAVCEQMESPEEAKKRGYKSVVKREVVRIVTKGTVVEDALLDANLPNYLLSIVENSGKLALSWLDISSGKFCAFVTNLNNLASDIARIAPAEIIIPDSLYKHQEIATILKEYRQIITVHAASMFDSKRAENRLQNFFKVAVLDGFGAFAKAEIIALGALVEYVELTQKDSLPRLEFPVKFDARNFMAIDAATRRNLELFSSISGNKKHSFFNVINQTVTNAGSRLLVQYIAAPLSDCNAVKARHDVVDFFLHNGFLREKITEILKMVPDIERALARICMNRGGPRDLASIRDGLIHSVNIAHILMQEQMALGLKLPAILQTNLDNIAGHDTLIVKLRTALVSEVTAMHAKDGGYIAAHYDAKLDDLRDLSENAGARILELREKYRQITGVSNLKITQNNVLGYFIEVTPANSNKISDNIFIHRQSLASAVRYTTTDLAQLENDIVMAKQQVLNLELDLFAELVVLIKEAADTIYLSATAIANIDVMAAFAELAATCDLTRPIVDDSLEFDIDAGRHIVVEELLKKSESGKSEFIKNSANLGPKQRFWLLTGPNMAGKSTFLRQNALIAIMAQIGCFVPAERAHIGVVDKVFSRVGAADDLARGQSTFMVEMVETAMILNNATAKSLVILDEIGRGTATYDGLSIAWAVVEHIHNVVRCRALFATHYHELAVLKSQLPCLANYSMSVKEWQGRVVFLHLVVKGAGDRSYGVHVAELAGMPKNVVVRARNILKILQEHNVASNMLTEELPLFAISEPEHNEPKLSTDNPEIQELVLGKQLLAKLNSFNIDELSPKAALEILYELKEFVGKGDPQKQFTV